MEKKDLPIDYIPSVKDTEWFLNYWRNSREASDQERALNKLFMDMCKSNNCIEDILIKCSSLNDFYSTNIYDIHAVARHILSLQIDERLEKHDLSLVEDIADVKEIGKTYYSFATKYCSHHQPENYAIYDSYVDNVLVSLNMRDKFANFKRSEDLKNYNTYMMAIKAFQQRYDLQYSIKKLDMYLWQLGKWYFNPYITFRYYNREEDNPFSPDDIKNKFWHGEMLFVTTHQNSNLWKQEGKEWLKTANEDIKKLAEKYSPEQFGLITYIAFQYSKWYPSDDPIWILEY
jgi:hypothetical protein